MEHDWEPMSIAEVRQRFETSDIDWWIAGGHAIDLFLGWETRTHGDLDVEMFRADKAALFDIFDGWDLHVVSDGQRTPWTDPGRLDDDIYGVWLRPTPSAPWQLEVMFAGGDRSQWRFRRDPSIRLAGDTLISFTSDGVPFCVPEVQLLYKSIQGRAKDDADLARCLHRMDAAQLRWLADAVVTTTPNHPWVGVLEAALERHHE